MQTPTHFVYNAAMAMNNIGISLLQRQANEKAVEALSSAVVLMREVAKGTFSTQTPSNQWTSVHAILTDAYHKIATCPISSKLSHFQVITHHDVFEMVQKYRHESVDADVELTPVLIRLELTANHVTDEKNFAPGLESSIILYNLGTAYLHMADIFEVSEYKMTNTAGFDVSKAIEKRQCACGLFQLSYSVLLMLVQEIVALDHDDLKLQFLPFMIRVLQSLVHTTALIGLAKESEFFRATTKNLLEVLQLDFDASALFIPNPAKAA